VAGRGEPAGGDAGLGAAAQLHFRVRPSRYMAVRDVVDRVVSAYDERVAMIVDEVVGVLGRPDRDPGSTRLVVVAGPELVEKAAKAPFRPGSRGGKWYRDSKGNIRYGDPPEGRYMGDAPDASPMPHLDHLRPGPFMGAFGNDRALVGFLAGQGAAGGFSDGDLRFLSAWYGTEEDGGALFDAFMECAGLTPEDLDGGVVNLRFGAQQLTYEEAVFEFFAAQGPLFMGDDSSSEAAVGEWHRVLNDEIKPLLDGVFVKYEEAKRDPEVQQRFKDDATRRRRRFFANARRRAPDLAGFDDLVVGDWKPDRQVDAAVVGLEVLGLTTRRSGVERHAYVHGRPHLRQAVMLDGRLLSDGSDGPLMSARDKLPSLPTPHLMLVYVASELNHRWDPHTRSFSTEKQAEVGSGALGEAVLAALAAKGPRWAEVVGPVSARLHALVDGVVTRLNAVNSREGYPDKHAPVPGRRAS